ncbi:unnamed protein product [Polarella glacialis]|uniref:Uncharacterized protein n=1 Tax=Polarella glacialis TaxID=89957 RepID=A0A813JRK1_POLGL|nr:unnamed protein product [Polarella glacialis]
MDTKMLQEDRKAFHKQECKQLVWKTKSEVGLKETRQADLQKDGSIALSFDLPMGGSTWRGDSLRAYLCNVALTTASSSVGKDMMVFSHEGFHFVFGELAHLDRPQGDLLQHLSHRRGKMPQKC